ncbi:hypothetical protein FRC03_003263, partial [Tulasnella sp. 419]
MPNISPDLVAVVGFLVFFVPHIHRVVTNPPPIGFIILGSYRHRLDFADFVAAFVIISLAVAHAFFTGQQRLKNKLHKKKTATSRVVRSQREDAFQYETDVASITQGFAMMQL